VGGTAQQHLSSRAGAANALAGRGLVSRNADALHQKFNLIEQADPALCSDFGAQITKFTA